MSVKQNKTVSKEQAVFFTVNQELGKPMEFECWPTPYKNSTLNHLYCPEMILKVEGVSKVFKIHIVYELGSRMLELKAIKLYIASLKDVLISKVNGELDFSSLEEKITTDLIMLSEPKSLSFRILDTSDDVVLEVRDCVKSDLPLEHEVFEIYSNVVFDTIDDSENFNTQLVSVKGKDNLFHILKNIQYMWNFHQFNNTVMWSHLSTPVIMDINVMTCWYEVSPETIHSHLENCIIELDSLSLVTEQVGEYLKNRLLELDPNMKLEIVISFHIRGNIKKIRSVVHGDLSEFAGRIAYISDLVSRFSSFTN